MKSNRNWLIWVFFVLVVGVGGMYAYSQKEHASVAEPEVIARQYYESHIMRLSNKSAVADITLHPAYVTMKFINTTNTLKAGFSEGGAYDPFLCAQDSPDTTDQLTVRVLERTDSHTKLDVKVFDSWPSIPVFMVKESGEWKIDKIECSI